MLRFIFFTLFFLNVNSCSQLPFSDELSDLSKDTAYKVLTSQLKEYVLNNAPILPSTKNPFAIADKLPGQEFKPDLKNQPKWGYSEEGEMLLSPGDYVFPVWTFCLNANAQSPAGHTYTLNKLSGSASKIVEQISLKAIFKYPVNDIQTLIWSLQAGLDYDEMTSKEQKIIDDIAIRFKFDLQKSFYKRIEEKWNHVSDKSQGVVPPFSDASDEFVTQMGSVGESIVEIRNLRNKILNAKGNYEILRRTIDTPRPQQNGVAHWSKISDRIYARFVTQGSYQEAGQLQVRVISSKRQAANAGQQDVIALDMSGLIADSGSAGVQSLSLAPLVGVGGVAVMPTISSNPYTVAAVMAAILAAQVIDWDAFFALANKTVDLADQTVKELIKYGNAELSEVHDRIERPGKDYKVISGKDLDKQKSDKQTRQYNKKGDSKTLDEDFDKLPGEKSLTQDGKEVKTFENGDKVIKRPKIKEKERPTLEFQPEKGRERVKQRYVE